MTQVLIAGATGYIGGHLAPDLLRRGMHVRCLARDPSRAKLPSEAEVVQGDVLAEPTLAPALEGVDVAYYLVHSMGGGRDGAFAQRDRAGAQAFARAASAAGVRRVVYLGGLEGGDSEHLRSREEVADILAAAVPATVHVRAAMVIGAGSASFLILRHLVERLPAMVCPRWIDTRTQPVAIRDVVGALASLADGGRAERGPARRRRRPELSRDDAPLRRRGRAPRAAGGARAGPHARACRRTGSAS